MFISTNLATGVSRQPVLDCGTTLLGDCWRHTCLRCIRACSALEALRNALYKCSTYLLTYFHPDFGSRDFPSILSDDLWKHISLATKAPVTLLTYRRYINECIFLSSCIFRFCTGLLLKNNIVNGQIAEKTWNNNWQQMDLDCSFCVVKWWPTTTYSTQVLTS